MKSRIETILLFLSVGIMMMMFMYQIYNNLFAKDADTIRIEQEREERRLQRQEMIKEYEKKGLYK
ncbi:hypothetical protein CN586_08500 [Bacillus toyonensis]|nr:hypothetical protein [Bacillus toyonensis]PEK51535.1 hypothetical protein CN586_08500 [Bacillus toyonensis]